MLKLSAEKNNYKSPNDAQNNLDSNIKIEKIIIILILSGQLHVNKTYMHKERNFYK